MNYAFTNGKILDGTKDMQVQTGLCILVQDGTITDIVPDTADLAGYKTIDLQGRYIMPGLINMHVHLAGNGKPQKKQRDNEKLVKKIMRSSLTRAVAYKMVSGFAKDELNKGWSAYSRCQRGHLGSGWTHGRFGCDCRCLHPGSTCTSRTVKEGKG